MAHRRIFRVVAVLAGLAVHGSAGDAWGANIASELGRPGTPEWEQNCGEDRTLPIGPGGDLRDSLTVCDESDPALCLHRVDIDMSEFPDAVCSDGTPASFYIRPATDSKDDRRWVIHLQGGGGCMTEEECKKRWCGTEFYTAAQMSNDWNADGVADRPEQAEEKGLPSSSAANNFATWNHVYVPYCTSDLWMGRANDVLLNTFSVDARGHTIISAVREMLRKGDANVAWEAVDGTGIAKLDGAIEILFTGTSAGGFGVLQNGDWFLEDFPDARAGLVSDASIDVHPDVILDWDLWEETTNRNYYSHRIDLYGARWAPDGYWHRIDGFVDESCANYYDLSRCASPTFLLSLNHGLDPLVETPIYLRMDLEDNVLAKWILGHNGPVNPDGDRVTLGPGGPRPTLQDYTEMMRETMVLLHADSEADISVFAPRCEQHVGLENDNATGVWTTQNTRDIFTPRGGVGTPSTLHDALWQWFNPGGPDFGTRTRHIDSDDDPAWFPASAYFSSCP